MDMSLRVGIAIIGNIDLLLVSDPLVKGVLLLHFFIHFVLGKK